MYPVWQLGPTHLFLGLTFVKISSVLSAAGTASAALQARPVLALYVAVVPASEDSYQCLLQETGCKVQRWST